MSYTKGPARVALTVFDGHSVLMEAFETLRAMVEHFVNGGELLYGPRYDPDELAAWLDTVADMARATAAQVRKDHADEQPDANATYDAIKAYNEAG